MPEKRGSARRPNSEAIVVRRRLLRRAGPVVDRARRDVPGRVVGHLADLPAVGAEVVGRAGGEAGDRAVVVDADGPACAPRCRRRCPPAGRQARAPVPAVPVPGAGAVRVRVLRAAPRPRPSAPTVGTAAGALGAGCAATVGSPAPRSERAVGAGGRGGGGRGGAAAPAGEERGEPDQRRDGARTEQRQTPDAQRGGPSGRRAAGQARSRQTSGDRLRRQVHGGLTRARIPGDAPHGCADGSCGACADA